MAIEVTNKPAESRFEVSVDGQLAGFAAYRTRPGIIAFVHTEIDPEFEGRGLAGQLVSAALDSVKAAGDAVLPFCPYVNGYIEKHPEYIELVPPEMREKFGLG